MGFIPKFICRHCGNEYLSIFNRCPHCGAKRSRQSGRAVTTTTAATRGSAANAKLNINTQWQFIFGCVLVVAVIAAVIILVSASLGGGGGKVDVEGAISWNIDPADTMPESVTVNLSANGQQVDSVTVTPDKDGNWVYSFRKLDAKDDDKNAIKYSVGVSSIAGKTINVSGTNIIISTTPKIVEPVEPEPAPTPTPNPNIHAVIINHLGRDLESEFSLASDESIDLDAIAYPVDEECVVMWKSTDESIFTVDADGVCTPVSNGWAKVVAYVGDVKHEINVRIWGFES